MSSPVSAERQALLATFSTRFAELRERSGLAPKEVAALCGVKVSSVYKWEAGDAALPYVWRLIDLAQHLGQRLDVDSDEILLWLIGRRSQAPFVGHNQAGSGHS